jgi:tetratricopeptide (TPR) repeat protein
MQLPNYLQPSRTGLSGFGLRWSGWILLCALVTSAGHSLEAQAAGHQAGANQTTPNASDELEGRLKAAQSARSTGDPERIIAANRLAIAASLRELAQLELLQLNYSKSIEDYRESLEYEDVTATVVALGFAELQAGQLDKAIEHANLAHKADPTNLRADRLLAGALDQKGEYAKAVEAFTRIARAEPTVDDLYPLAECLLQTKKPEDRQRAQAVFEQMKQVAGDSGSLHVLIGRAYRDGGDIQAAIREFRRAIAIDPKTPHAHYFLGLAQLFANDWKPTPAIEEAFRQETEVHPEDYLANYMLGVALSGEHKYDESDKYLTAASRINPALPDTFLYMGVNAFDQQKMDRAEAMMRKAIELTGSDDARTNYQIRKAYVDMARILGQSGRMEESRSYAAKARELQNKTMVETQQKVSKMMADNGRGAVAGVVPLTKEQENQSAPAVEDKDDPRARRRLTAEEVAAVDARSKAVESALALALNDMATANAMQKNYAEALRYYQQAEHWDSTLGGLEKNLGLCAFKVKDYAEAARALGAALAQGQDTPGLRAMLGISYFATDKFAQAAHTFEPLGAQGMADSETGYAWAASLTRTGDMKKATEVLAAYEAQPRTSDAMLLVGQLWTEIGDFERAIATLQRALAANPKLAKAHFYEGLAYIRWEKWPEAAEQFEDELQVTPDDLDALYHLGFVDQQQSKVDEALALYLRVIKANPNYANAQYEAGKIMVDRGKFGDAVGHLEIAAGLSPEKDYIHYQLQATYRKLGRNAEADRELDVYKQIKSRSRERVADELKKNK